MPMPNILPGLDWEATFAEAMDYRAWLAAGESASNIEVIEAMHDELEFTPVAEARLNAISRPVHVVAIAEDWCPDVMRHVPVLQRMAESNDKLQVRYLMRADRPEVFARYLTAGGEAIPKFVFLNHEFVECGEWGPMPADCRELIARGRACGDLGKAREKVFARYGDDPTRAIVVDELLHQIENASCEEP